MKNIFIIAFLITTLCSCLQTGQYDPIIIERQTAFFAELKSYALPATSIPSKLPANNPSFNLYLAAEKIAEQQGLISDATMAPVGKLVVGRKQDGDNIIVGVQFIQFDGGGVGFENITKANGLHIRDVQKMEKKYISALTKEFYANFNK